MKPESQRQSEQSPRPVNQEENIASEATSEAAHPTAADYIYRIAAVTAGIILLATII
jgi:hypothetical protein